MRTIRIMIVFAFCWLSGTVYGQLTLEDCYLKARMNYPQVKQYGLIAQSEGYSLQNASRGYLPQVSLSAKATWQTAVTSVPVSIPGINIPTIRKDQYQALAEVTQVIWDGGTIRSQKEQIAASSQVDREQYEVDMYALNQRINDLFFGILLFEEQLKQQDLYIKELNRNLQNIESYIRNGTANQADRDAVLAEILSTEQGTVELEVLKRSYTDMLLIFIGERPDGQTTQLMKPAIPVHVESEAINRPELALMEARKALMESQKKAVRAKNLPKISAFVQGGYGNPGLNMFKNKFTTFALGGIRLNWNFGGFYTKRNEMRLIDVSRQTVDIQKETFLFNTRLQTTGQQAQIEKYRRIMQSDERIIALRQNITRAAEAKVANGALSVTELVREMIAEESARQAKALHEIELLKSFYDLKTTVNQ